VDFVEIETFEGQVDDESFGFPENENGIQLGLEINGDTMNIKEQNWGVGRIMVSGNYDRPDGAGEELTWEQFTGEHNSRSDDGSEQYVFYTIEGVDNLENFLRMDIIRTHIDYYSIEGDLGTIVGVYEVGEYDGERGYEGIGSMVFQYEPLTFVSAISVEDEDYSLNGLFGSSDCLWNYSPTNVLFRGEYFTENEGSGETYLWGAGLSSHDFEENTAMTYDGGAYVGRIAGYVKNPAASVFRAIYVSPTNEVGYFGGKLTGDTYSDINMFEMTGAVEMNPMEYNEEILVTPGMLNGLETSFIDGYGSYGEHGSNEYMSGEIVGMGNALQLPDAGWGIWEALFQGQYAGDLSDWTLPFVGEIKEVGSSYRSGIFIGMIEGAWVPNDHSEATFNGIWVSPNHDRVGGGTYDGTMTSLINFSFGTMSGDIVMNNEGEYVDGGEDFACNWAGAGAGEWVEVEDLVDLTDLASEMQGLMTDFENMTQVTYTLIAGAGQVSGHITSAAMDIALCTYEDINLWAALISGTYDYDTEASAPEEWGASFGVADSPIILKGLGWDNNTWSADVSGTVDGNSINGMAVGTYDGTDGIGTFEGVGGGTFLPGDNNELAR